MASIATVAGVAISLLAAGFTLDQIRVAEQQNKVAEEESLTTLVAELTHEARSLTGANEEQQSAIKQARLGDAEEAFALVDRLHEQAPAIDNYEIGLAFKEEDEDDKAIVSFGRAGSVTGSPHFRSAALLQEAGTPIGPAGDQRRKGAPDGNPQPAGVPEGCNRAMLGAPIGGPETPQPATASARASASAASRPISRATATQYSCTATSISSV